MSYMRPVGFDGCFGWLHLPAGNAVAGTAVVLCPGLTTDRLTAHRSFRLLADAFAASGYPTLRFDYPGTGDSCDLDVIDHWRAWKQSINTAVDWLRDCSKARRVVLCGLRIGAALAATVAEDRKDVAGLVLLAPILRGRSYIRQLSIEANMPLGGAPILDAFAVQELQLSDKTIQLINQVDLRKITPNLGCRVAVYPESPSPVLSECVDAWSRRGITITCEPFAGLEPLLRPTLMSHEPPAEVTAVTAWLRASVPAEPEPLQEGCMLASPEFSFGSCIEIPLRFGAERNLFGVLCRPASQNESDEAVIIVNSSGNPHYGFARAAVDLARRLAAEGIASLRIDFAGLGDSVAPGDDSTHVFETDRRPDVKAAIDLLEEREYRRFAIQGLCSGAYHAYHAALADPRVGLLLLVNLQVFQWRAGDPIDFMGYALHSPMHFLGKLGRKGPWMQLLQGRLEGRRKLAMQGIWFARRAKAVTQSLAARLGFGSQPNLIQQSLNRLSQRARILFLFSEGDAGLVTLAEAYGPGWPPFGSTVRVLPGLDHSLTRHEMRKIVADDMIEFLKQDLQPADAVR
jgi:pimeloyl-ACP methyl ester carboxylesterase